MGNRPGHNATDIALVIGAMDLLYRGMKHFCLVAGDSDYVPLVQRLRQDGCTIMVIGTPAVSAALKETSSLFVSTDHLLPQASSTSPAPSPTSSSPVLTSLQTSQLSTMLMDAYHVTAQQNGTEWVLLSSLGSTLRQRNFDFETTYGKQRLSGLIKQCSASFETRRRKNGKGEAEEVRLRNV